MPTILERMRAGQRKFDSQSASAIVSQKVAEKSYEGTPAFRLAEQMVEKWQKLGMPFGRKVTNSVLSQIAHQISLYASDNSMQSAISHFYNQGVETEKMKEARQMYARALSNADNNPAIFDLQNPTVTAIFIAIMVNTVNADVKSYSATKSMVGAIDTILRHNLVANQDRTLGGETIAKGTILSGALGEFQPGYSTNVASFKSTPLATANPTLQFQVGGALQEGSKFVESTLVLKVAINTGTVEAPVIETVAVANDSIFDGGAKITGTSLVASGTFDYSTGAGTITLTQDALAGTYVEGYVSINYTTTETNEYNLGVATSDFDKLRIATSIHGLGTFVDSVANAMGETSTGIDSNFEAVQKALAYMNTDTSYANILRLKVQAEKSVVYNSLENVAGVDNASATFPLGRWNIMFAIQKVVNDMGSETGVRPNCIVVGNDIASVLQTFPEFESDTSANFILGEHTIGKLKGMDLEVVLSPRALNSDEMLFIQKRDEDNSSAVTGDYLPLLQGLPVPGAMSIKQFNTSLKGFVMPLGYKGVWRMTAPGLFDTIFKG